MPKKRDGSETLMDCWVDTTVAQAATRAAHDLDISRAELMRVLVSDYLVYAGYLEH